MQLKASTWLEFSSQKPEKTNQNAEQNKISARWAVVSKRMRDRSWVSDDGIIIWRSFESMLEEWLI